MPHRAADGVNGKRSSGHSIDTTSESGNEHGSAQTYMSGPDFLDTNVLVYAYDLSEVAKQTIARDLLRRALNGEIVVSTQVLAEFVATLLHKLPPGAAGGRVRILDALGPIKVIVPDSDTVRRAVQAVAAAERGGCTRVFSEDLSAGQSYFGIEVANPFV